AWAREIDPFAAHWRRRQVALADGPVASAARSDFEGAAPRTTLRLLENEIEVDIFGQVNPKVVVENSAGRFRACQGAAAQRLRELARRGIQTRVAGATPTTRAQGHRRQPTRLSRPARIRGARTGQLDYWPARSRGQRSPSHQSASPDRCI